MSNNTISFNYNHNNTEQPVSGQLAKLFFCWMALWFIIHISGFWEVEQWTAYNISHTAQKKAASLPY